MAFEKSPHVPAAFINAIAEEGTKEEAIKALQEIWNDYCHAMERLRELDKRSAAASEQQGEKK